MTLHQKLFWLLVFLLPLQLGRHFWPEWSYVLGLRVDYLSPTIYLTDILVMVILGLWGIEKIYNLQFTIYNLLRHYWWIIAVFAYLLVNSFLAQNQGAAFYKFAKIIEFTLLGFYIAKNQYSVFSIQSSLAGAVIYSSLIAIFQFFKQASLNGVFWWLGERTFNAGTPGIAKAVVDGQLIMRPYATFPHPNALAGFLLVSLILIGVRRQASGVRRFLYWLAIALGIVAISISFSRSAWLVGLVVWLWGQRLRLLRGGGILFAIIVTLLLFKLPFSTDEAILQRLYLFKVASLMIQSAPLTGIGLNNFMVRLPEFWQTSGFTYWLQPVHNIYLLIAAETGLIGLLIFLWFVYLTYKRLLLITNYQLLITLSAILALGLFDHYWLTLQQTQLLFAIVIGLSWGKREQKNKKL